MAFRRHPKRPRGDATLPLFAELAANNQATPRPCRHRPRHADPSAYKQVRAELEGEWKLPLRDVEDLAEAAHREGALEFPFLSPVLFAATLGYAADPYDGGGCGVTGLSPYILHCRRSADVLRWNLRVLHELAHALLRRWREAREGREYTHADVWGLTLMLAVPRSALKLIDLARHVPQYALKLRGQLARAVRAAA
ncbi:MAG: hypothetical protein Q8S73_36740 [Deltaproteobacteria bacterium]|nr:hypothetical protein [Myxococcales bacterium]MDP3219707.1 hypothetical protein [Deltaproteobacteria bacterium]